MKGQLMQNERESKEQGRQEAENGERVYSEMGFSLVQKSLIANSVQSLCGPPGPWAVLLRRLRGLLHQSQGSEPFTNFPWDLPGRQPQCWASLLS